MRIVGTLAEGTTVSSSTELARDGSLPLYVSLYARGGAVCGRVSLISQESSDLNGAVTWFKPVRPKDKYYPEGWPQGAVINLRGSHYAKPSLSAPRASGALDGSGTPAIVTFTGGDLPGDMQIPVTISSYMAKPLTETKGFKFSIATATGIFKGMFVRLGTGKTQTFSGVLLQSQNVASGSFLGPTQSGQVVVTPN